MVDHSTRDQTERVNSRNLFERIRDGEEIDFLCFAITPWHAMGVDAFLLDNNKRERKKSRGCIVINAHRRQGFLLGQDDFVSKDLQNVQFLAIRDEDLDILKFFGSRPVLKAGLALLKWAFFKCLRSVQNKKRKKLHIVSPVNPNIFTLLIFSDSKLSRRYQPAYHVVDEGFGSYRRFFRGWLGVRIRSWKKKGLGSKIMLLVNLIYDLTYRLLVATVARPQRRHLFSAHEGRKLGGTNPSIFRLYREVIEIRSQRIPQTLPDKTNPDICVLITQPLSELASLSPEQELSFIQRVINVLAKSGCHVILKPHPREEKKKYLNLANIMEPTAKFQVDNSGLCLEIWLSVAMRERNVRFVAGYASTALMTAKALFQIPAVSFYYLLSTPERHWFNRFLNPPFDEMTSELLDFPANWDEFERKVCEYR